MKPSGEYQEMQDLRLLNEEIILSQPLMASLASMFWVPKTIKCYVGLNLEDVVCYLFFIFFTCVLVLSCLLLRGKPNGSFMGSRTALVLWLMHK